MRKDNFSPISCLLADEPALAFGPAMMDSEVWLHAVSGVSDFHFLGLFYLQSHYDFASVTIRCILYFVDYLFRCFLPPS